MLQMIDFSHLEDPTNWSPAQPKVVKFKGNIAQFLADQRNVDDLDAVLAGKAIIIRLNPKTT